MKNCLLFLICLLNSNSTIRAQGLSIYPSRVVFEERQVKTTIELINTGKEQKTYSVSFVQRNMDENGKFTQITTPGLGQMFSDKLLRIYPRRVTLMPGEGQIVMLQRKRNSNLKTGEYRSHLFFRANPENTALAANEPVEQETIGVQIKPIFGFTIPIIVRSGEINVSTTLTDLKIENLKKPVLRFTINRIGNISTYGNFKVEYVPEKGKVSTIGAVNGVSVYTTIKKRFLSISLTNITELDLTKGSLKLTYTNRNNNKAVFSTASLLL